MFNKKNREMKLPEEVTDRMCRLECAKGNVHEFVGPVRLILVDPPPGEYCRKRLGAALIHIANMMIGATFLIVFFFTLSFVLTLFNNLHVMLCTFGLVLFLPSGVLMCTELNGASVPLKVIHRLQQHFLLMFAGITCTTVGGLLVFGLGKTSENKISAHSFFGALAICLGLTNVIIGPINYIIRRGKSKKCFKKLTLKLHIVFGVSCLMASSLCFILGVSKSVFAKWVPLQSMVYGLIVCCVFYTLVILFVPLSKLLFKAVPLDEKQ